MFLRVFRSPVADGDYYLYNVLPNGDVKAIRYNYYGSMGTAIQLLKPVTEKVHVSSVPWKLKNNALHVIGKHYSGLTGKSIAATTQEKVSGHFLNFGPYNTKDYGAIVIQGRVVDGQIEIKAVAVENGVTAISKMYGQDLEELLKCSVEYLKLIGVTEIDEFNTKV